MTRVGMVGSSSSMAAWTRPCPLRIIPASSTKIGAVKPNFWILLLSLTSCLSLCVRGFPGHGLRSLGARSIRPDARWGGSGTLLSLVFIGKLLVSNRWKGQTDVAQTKTPKKWRFLSETDINLPLHWRKIKVYPEFSVRKQY